MISLRRQLLSMSLGITTSQNYLLFTLGLKMEELEKSLNLHVKKGHETLPCCSDHRVFATDQPLQMGC